MIKYFCLLLIILSPYANSETRWQTTHRGNFTWYTGSSGTCKLINNSFRIIVHKVYLEVEEEAEIAAMGSVFNGDSATLEISGQFRLFEGSAVRSMLLWNGNKLLKAKLRDRNAADSAYEQVVERDKVNYVPRDPALIEYSGNNLYNYRIYPVEIKKSRKIRISYIVPLSFNGGKTELVLHPAFTQGTQENPKSFQIEFLNSDTGSADYYLALNNGSRKLIDFGAIYQIGYSELAINKYSITVNDPVVVKILVLNSKINCVYSCNVANEHSAGYYSAVIARIPDTLRTMIKESAIFNYSIDAKISTAEKSYINSLPVDGTFGIYMKSQSLWDGTILWRVYNKNGEILLNYKQIIEKDTSSQDCYMVPFLWASRYSLVENNGNQGALFGFVDSRMSLLALESDALAPETASLYAYNGVPALLPEEIIIDPSKIPHSPQENIMVDYTSVNSINHLINNHLLCKVNDHCLIIESIYSEVSPIRMDIYDLKGRLVYSQDKIKINGKRSIELPRSFRGTFIVKIQSKSEKMQQRIVLK